MATPASITDTSVDTLSQWALIRRRFAHHKLAVASLYLLAVLYALALGAEFFAPYPRRWRDLPRAYCPPQLPQFSWKDGLHVPAMRVLVDPMTFKKSYIEDESAAVKLGFSSKERRMFSGDWFPGTVISSASKTPQRFARTDSPSRSFSSGRINTGRIFSAV